MKTLLEQIEIPDTFLEIFPNDKIAFYKIHWNVDFYCFFILFRTTEELEKSWEKFNSNIAAHYHNNFENDFQLWNIYCIYVCKEKANKALKFKIEYDPFITRKLVLENENINNNFVNEVVKQRIINSDLEILSDNNFEGTKYKPVNKEIWKIISDDNLSNESGKRKNLSLALESIQKVIKS